MKHETIGDLLSAALVFAFAAYFVGGFVAGMCVCSDCDTDLFAATIGRVLMGFVYCVMSAFTFGFPPGRFDKDAPINVWPYIGGSWVVMMAAYLAFGYFRRDRSKS